MVGPLRAPYLSTTTKRLTSKGRPARGSGADPGGLRILCERPAIPPSWFRGGRYLLKLLCWGDFPEQLSEEDFARELQGGLGCSDIVLGGIT